MRRIERKFLLNKVEYEFIKSKVTGLLPLDKHTESQGYRLHSIYYDTVRRHLLTNKINGEDRSLRLRVREYENKSLFLELKIDQGLYQYKYRERINEYNDINKLLESSKIDFIQALGIHFEFEEVMQIQYFREAFQGSLEGEQIRICFDHDVTAEHESSKNPVGDQKIIMEIKSPGLQLPTEIFSIINSLKKQMIKFSKYENSMETFYGRPYL